MKCPRDGTELSKVELLGLELDKCHACDGIWFDRGELETLSEAKDADIEEVLERKYGNPKVKEGKPEGYMRCPRCGSRLREQYYTYLNPVRVDRCETCFGFWMDDEELNAVVGEREKLDAYDEKAKSFLRAIFGKLTRDKGKRK